MADARDTILNLARTGMQDWKIGEIVGRSARAVGHVRRRAGVKKREFRPDWSENEAQIVRTLWLNGRSGSEIAQYFGVTRNAVLGLIRRRSWTRSRGPAV